MLQSHIYEKSEIICIANVDAMFQMEFPFPNFSFQIQNLIRYSYRNSELEWKKLSLIWKNIHIHHI